VRVVYLNPVGGLGGAEQVLLNVMAGVRRTRPDATLHLIAGADGPLLARTTELGVGVTPLPMPAALLGLGDSQLRAEGRLRGRLGLLGRAARALPAVWLYARRLRRAVRGLGADLVHSNGLKTHLLARFAGLGPTPVVWHLHDFVGLRPVMARALRRVAGRAAGAVAVSRAVAEDAARTLPGLPVEVIPNAIDLDRFRPGPGAGEDLDRLAGLPAAGPGTVRVGLVATYARWKGHRAFLEAAARVPAGPPGPPVRFYVVGGPIYHTAAQESEGELREYARGLGIADRVGFVGFREDTPAVYQALDVVVHASTLPEPFGLTVAEAMACGRAVVVSQAGGAAELFTPGHDALGVPPGDTAALADAIRRLAADEELRRQLGVNARITAERQFDRQRLGPQVLAFYDRVLGR
jgi:glycosyltransferase involved in cell wall biosynthesis